MKFHMCWIMLWLLYHEHKSRQHSYMCVPTDRGFIFIPRGKPTIRTVFKMSLLCHQYDHDCRIFAWSERLVGRSVWGRQHRGTCFNWWDRRLHQKEARRKRNSCSTSEEQTHRNRCIVLPKLAVCRGNRGAVSFDSLVRLDPGTVDRTYSNLWDLSLISMAYQVS